jgi:hypothetical protein
VGETEISQEVEVIMSDTATVAPIAGVLRRELLRLARDEENQAAAEAAAVPYWAVGPPSIQGHRTAAAILRAKADKLLAEG